MNVNEKVQDHFSNPRNVGSLDKGSPRVGTGVGRAGDCGDVMRLQIEVDDDGTIRDAKFKTFGCPAAIAASSYTTEWLKGKTLDEAKELTDAMVADVLGLSEEKRHCSVLAKQSLDAALADLRSKQAPSDACDAPAACGKPVRLTRSAAAQVRKLFELHHLPEGACLRIRVSTGADGSDVYELDVTHKPAEDDEVFESFGVRVVCDADSYLRLAGVEVDYIEQFMRRGFAFRYAGEGICACGRSPAHE